MCLEAVAEDAVQFQVLADSGSDVNMIRQEVLDELGAAGVTVNTQTLTTPEEYSGYVPQSKFHVKQTVVLSARILVRHAKSLAVENILFRVAPASMDVKNVLSKFTLQRLGLDVQEVLTAAVARGPVDMEGVDGPAMEGGRIATLMTSQMDMDHADQHEGQDTGCLLYTSPSPRDGLLSRMPSSA